MNEQQQQAVEMMKVEGLCTLCEEVIAPILDYLSNSTNQTELTAALHMLCSFTFIFKDEVIFRPFPYLVQRFWCKKKKKKSFSSKNVFHCLVIRENSKKN